MCSLFTIERTDLTRLFGVKRAAPVREGEQRPGQGTPQREQHRQVAGDLGHHGRRTGHGAGGGHARVQPHQVDHQQEQEGRGDPASLIGPGESACAPDEVEPRPGARGHLGHLQQ